MKRRDLIRYLESEGCALLREGGRHSWWHNPSQNRRSAIPRHREINNHAPEVALAERVEVLATVTVSGKPNVEVLPGTLNNVLKQAGLKR
ncbi:type II toxin-antitoxin system HicA family toxin [Aquisalimonas sp.]|uniref:type II toxin-antitoxin system HicA family toxin n=1 Tax=Aquisalimonas sp. TaxID=1872621 RepID=UPI0025C63BD9|nr:type II toxin-antitoxin system HicA family toxin [Aquisalimonas sp.]